jgi:tetratricopeptide (TPR) repeat protein
LAIAYQGLGDHAKAEASLREYSVDGFEPEIADPMADALGAKVAASRALLRRGQRFGRSMRFDLAEPAFRAAVEADPTNAEAVANLGVTLANLGKLDEAQQALNQSLKLDDHNALAHLSLGVVLDRQGNDQGAIAQYKAASDADPGNVDALVYLADAQMRLGHADEAIKSYEQALARVGGSERIELSIALANVKAGHYPQARKALESASKAYPNNPELTNALARLLATAPLSSVRDGERALGLAKPLFESSHNPIVGETYAMALAETGNYNQAELLQKETIIVFEHTGGKYRKPFLERNLALYQQHRATREGWAADDPVFEPRSPAAQLARANEGSDTQTSAH